DKRLRFAGKVGAQFRIPIGIRQRPFVAPGEEAGMTDGMHKDRNRRQRLAVVEPQHLYSRIVRTVGVQTEYGPTVDHLAAIDAEADLVLAIADGDGPQ